MTHPINPPSNAFIGLARGVYTPIGFSKVHNFFSFLLFGGALMGFVLARLMYIDIENVFCGAGFSPTKRASPGECYYYQSGLYRAGMLLHLACILPAGFLVVFQFVPAIRHKWLLVHRINGYMILLLSLAGSAGALIVTRRAFGGGLDVQAGFGMITIMFLVSILMAYINIKKLRIDQHRAWMLRAWFYAGAIITVRPILFITALIISNQGPYYEAMPCHVVEFLNSTGQVSNRFPTCTSPDAWTVARADMNDKSPTGPAASLRAGFGMAGWLALALHAIGIEIYLHLTPAESNRLREVSHQRQLEAGMRKPERDGLSTVRLEDTERSDLGVTQGRENVRKS